VTRLIQDITPHDRELGIKLVGYVPKLTLIRALTGPVPIRGIPTRTHDTFFLFFLGGPLGFFWGSFGPPPPGFSRENFFFHASLWGPFLCSFGPPLGLFLGKIVFSLFLSFFLSFFLSRFLRALSGALLGPLEPLWASGAHLGPLGLF
jgi:hypothetical protein